MKVHQSVCLNKVNSELSVISELMSVCDLVVVSVGDGVGCDSSLLHLQQDSDCEDRLTVQTTQLHQDPVTNLTHTHTHTEL